MAQEKISLPDIIDFAGDAFGTGIDFLNLWFSGQNLIESGSLARQQAEALRNLRESGLLQGAVGFQRDRVEGIEAGTNPFLAFIREQAVPNIAGASNQVQNALSVLGDQADAIRRGTPGLLGREFPQSQADPVLFNIQALREILTPVPPRLGFEESARLLGGAQGPDVPSEPAPAAVTQEPAAPPAASQQRPFTPLSPEEVRVRDYEGAGISYPTPERGPGNVFQIEQRPAVKRTPIKQPFVGSFQQGTPFVPQTGLAKVHQGEAIIPKNQNPFVGQQGLPPVAAPAQVAASAPGPALAPAPAQIPAPAPIQQPLQKGGGPAAISNVPFPGQPPPVPGGVPVTPPAATTQAAADFAAQQATAPGDRVTPDDATQAALRSLMTFLNQGGPFGTEQEALLGQQARDTAELQRQATDRAIREQFGGRGLGDSALQGSQQLQNQLASDANITRALNDIGLARTSENFAAMQGIMEQLIGGGLATGEQEFRQEFDTRVQNFAEFLDISTLELEQQIQTGRLELDRGFLDLQTLLGGGALDLEEMLGLRAADVADAQIGVEQDALQIERDRLAQLESQFQDQLGFSLSSFTQSLTQRVTEFGWQMGLDQFQSTVLASQTVIAANQVIADLLRSGEDFTTEQINTLLQMILQVAPIDSLPT